MKKTLFLFNAWVHAILFIISFSGIMLIYSSRYDRHLDLGSTDFALKQFFFLIIGFLCMEYLRKVDFHKLLCHSKVLFFAALVILYGVLLFGVKINGMRGWFYVGKFSLQPSELFKCIYVLYISAVYMKAENKERAFLQNGLLSIVWIGAILLEPDYGTAVIYGIIFAITSFLAGVKLSMLALLPLCAVTSLFVFIGRKAYGFNRIYEFFSGNADISGTAWHWKQFQLAIARGGWFGNKLDGTFWSNNYLPFAYNDSAYAAMHEATGIVGAAIILILFFVLFILFYRESCCCKDNQLVIISVISAILMQVLMHCSINCVIIPTTGLTMPLISYGGSSLVGTFLLLGLALSFCKQMDSTGE